MTQPFIEAFFDEPTNTIGFDRLFDDGERFAIGELEVEVLHDPGHSPADVAYRIGDAAFVGDPPHVRLGIEVRDSPSRWA